MISVQWNSEEISTNGVSEQIYILRCALRCALISLCSWRSQSLLLQLELMRPDTAVIAPTAASGSSLPWHCTNWDPGILNANFGKSCSMNLFLCEDARGTESLGSPTRVQRRYEIYSLKSRKLIKTSTFWKKTFVTQIVIPFVNMCM